MCEFYIARLCLVAVVVSVFAVSLLVSHTVKHIYAVCHHHK